jgi:hypothetical protein
MIECGEKNRVVNYDGSRGVDINRIMDIKWGISDGSSSFFIEFKEEKPIF